MSLRLVHAKPSLAIRQYDPERYDDLVIHDRHAVVIPFHWETNGDTRVVEISKDHLVSATLDVEMIGYPPLTGIKGEYLLDGTKLIEFVWEFWESGVRKSRLGIDVKAFLRHGKNEFTARAWKAYLIFESSVVFTTTLHLYYKWEEWEKSPTPPKPPAPEWWAAIEPYVKWGLVAVGVVGAVFVGLELVKKRR